MKIKTILKSLLCIIISLVIIFGIYASYVFISYHRVEDNLNLEITNNTQAIVPINKDLSILSWNIGFAAYTDDFSFFMDGGKYSRAISKQAADSNLKSIIQTIEKNKCDFMIFQEVDLNSTRTYGQNQYKEISNHFSNYSNSFAINYDSPYLFYPILSPFGKANAGNLTLTNSKINSALRRSLPIETGFMKLLDLDRCYHVSRIPVENNKELLIYNVHLSAYTSDGTIADEQLEMLYQDIKSEQEKGNYIICGGDFNKDLLGNSQEIFGVKGNYTWAKEINKDKIPNGFSLIAPFNKNNPIPSCRNADTEYKKGETFVLTVDGFIVSDNIEVYSSNVINEEFKYSDHNPVYMNFKLK